MHDSRSRIDDNLMPVVYINTSRVQWPHFLLCTQQTGIINKSETQNGIIKNDCTASVARGAPLKNLG